MADKKVSVYLQRIFNDSVSMDCLLDQQPCDYELPEEGDDE